MINLDSQENEILLNPRFPEQDFSKLFSLAKLAGDQLSLKSHVWIATSGSTAESVSATKLVALSKQALRASALAVNDYLAVTEEDTWAQVLPNFHVGGLGIEIRAKLSRSNVVPALRNGKWDPNYFTFIVEEDGCTLAALVPTQIYDLVKNNLKSPKCLRAVVVGGGAFSEDLYLNARQLGWPVLPSYGMSETASQIATASLDSLETMEYPKIKLLPHAQARTNAQGFLEVMAKSLFTTYAQNTVDGPRYWDSKMSDGWFVTEDKAQVIQGCLEIFGRSKDYIKIGGEAVNVADLRATLESTVMALNPAWLMEVTLLDMDSERLGSEIHLVTTLSEKEAQQIAEAYGNKVMPFAKIRKIHLISQIPRSDLGKILWVQLRNLI